MIRRSFRIGLKLGLLAGLAFALVKTMQSRRPSADLPASPAPWTPLQPEPARAPAPAAVVAPEPEREPEPVAVSELDEAAERWSEPAAPPVAAAAPALAAFPATKAVKAVKAVKKAAKKAAAPAKKAAKKAVALAPWVEPTGGVCPTTHPVKAKLHSRIFHLPGMLNYGRVTPDRCYITAEAAAADDLRPSKR